MSYELLFLKSTALNSILALGNWFQPVNERRDFEMHLALEEVEYQHILKVLEKTHWKINGKNGTAERLGINASTLRSRMNKLDIQQET